MNILVRTVALGAIVGLLACQNSSQPRQNAGARESSWIPDPAATLASEYYSGFDEVTHRVVTSAPDWANAWAQLYRRLQPKPDLPAVSFLNHRVIIVGLGTKNSGGYAIRLDSLVTFENGTRVFTTAQVPGDSCGVTGALTQPVFAVRVPIPAEPVVFEQQTVVHNCG
jgi:hypothetical protein